MIEVPAWHVEMGKLGQIEDLATVNFSFGFDVDS